MAFVLSLAWRAIKCKQKTACTALRYLGQDEPRDGIIIVIKTVRARAGGGMKRPLPHLIGLISVNSCSLLASTHPRRTNASTAQPLLTCNQETCTIKIHFSHLYAMRDGKSCLRISFFNNGACVQLLIAAPCQGANCTFYELQYNRAATSFLPRVYRNNLITNCVRRSLKSFPP